METTKPHDPINPTTEIGNNGEVSQGFGLTKREHFACMAMQGWISSLDHSTIGNGDMDNVVKLTAIYAISFADELIKKLNNEI